MGVNVVGGDVIRSGRLGRPPVCRLPTGVDAARRGCRVGHDALPPSRQAMGTTTADRASLRAATVGAASRHDGARAADPPTRRTPSPASGRPPSSRRLAAPSVAPSPCDGSADHTTRTVPTQIQRRRDRVGAGGAGTGGATAGSVKGGVAATRRATAAHRTADTASPATAVAPQGRADADAGPSSPEPLTPLIPIPADHLRRLTAPSLTICDGSAKTRPVPTQIQRRRDRVGAAEPAPGAGRRQRSLKGGVAATAARNAERTLAADTASPATADGRRRSGAPTTGPSSPRAPDP